jgi:hypothetical protein
MLLPGFAQGCCIQDRHAGRNIDLSRRPIRAGDDDFVERGPNVRGWVCRDSTGCGGNDYEKK